MYNLALYSDMLLVNSAAPILMQLEKFRFYGASIYYIVHLTKLLKLQYINDMIPVLQVLLQK